MDTAFDPIVGDNPRVLILGSMPGQTSLQDKTYYAHPQNAFWWIMAQLFQIDFDASYAARCQDLKREHIAVWDVLRQCVRPGSLDSAIERNSEVPSDIESLVNSHPGLRSIIFNGGTAQRLFKRHQAKLFNSKDLRFCLCPSTSPAYASMPRATKLAHWQVALQAALS